MTDLRTRILKCQHCPRLRAYRKKNTERYPDYWNKPVPASGKSCGLTIVGLAPGLHGANKTGIPFTGDASGKLLFECLNELGLQKQVLITNVVKCAPPDNLPLASERKNCRKFLNAELIDQQQALGRQVYFCLGRVAHEELIRGLGLRQRDYPFAHENIHSISDGIFVVDSYHCSRYNINTGRITKPMFLSALQSAAKLAQL